MSDWAKKDIWTRRGEGFLIEVSRHTVESRDPYEGTNRWCVYAYVYPKHPHFKNFEGDRMWQDAAAAMPLHCGPSLLSWTYAEDGTALSVKVGADYHHLGDDSFSHYESMGDAVTVFRDAEELYAWLDEWSKQ